MWTTRLHEVTKRHRLPVAKGLLMSAQRFDVGDMRPTLLANRVKLRWLLAALVRAREAARGLN